MWMGQSGCYFSCKKYLEAGYGLKLFFSVALLLCLPFLVCNLKAFPHNHEDITAIPISNRI